MMAEIRSETPGLLRVILHWSIALFCIGLFISGLVMVELDYYHPWYHRLPWWHKSLGVLVIMLVLFHLFCSSYQQKTRTDQTNKAKRHAWLVLLFHRAMEGVILLIGISGYFIVTAQGQDLNMFDIIAIPPIITNIVNLEDKAGIAHYYLAYLLMFLVFLHTAAALKHHFIDKDDTLLTMLGQHRN